MSLVVYANDTENGRHASQIITGLVGPHPSRTIIIVARPNESVSRIETELAAHCHIASGLEQKVCCEEITMTVSGPPANHLHSVLAPLLIPDLPNYVWWIGGLPHDHHLFGDMMDTADRFIVDSARFTRTALDLPQLEHLSTRSDNCALGDLNWQRLSPWRQLLVQECTTPALQPHIRQVTSVKLAFARNKNDQRWSQVLLMAGWLSRFLSLDSSALRIDGPGAGRITQDDRDVTFKMVPTEFPGAMAGDLVSIDVRWNAGDETSSLAISRKADPLHLDIVIHEPNNTLQKHARVESGDEGAALGRALNSLTHDPEYSDALGYTLPFVPAAG
jgi:hypothetical protein